MAFSTYKPEGIVDMEGNIQAIQGRLGEVGTLAVSSVKLAAVDCRTKTGRNNAEHETFVPTVHQYMMALTFDNSSPYTYLNDANL